jgi:hypothetical protein
MTEGREHHDGKTRLAFGLILNVVLPVKNKVSVEFAMPDGGKGCGTITPAAGTTAADT